jgi:hypothetical protein
VWAVLVAAIRERALQPVSAFGRRIGRFGEFRTRAAGLGHQTHAKTILPGFHYQMVAESEAAAITKANVVAEDAESREYAK